jgi:hypothetical protein
MSRSGYSEECENLELYRGAVNQAIHGKRGQAFLREMAAAMDAMPEKKLIESELINPFTGGVCAIGSVFKARGTDVSKIDAEEPDEVAKAAGIARCMAAEIAFVNDEEGRYYSRNETPEQRWFRVRQWVEDQI